MKPVFIRTDASLQMGSGHVMRCLTLADELRQHGFDIKFICREHSGSLVEMIQGKGYLVARLPQAEAGYKATIDDVTHASWLGCSWQHDAAETIEALGGVQPEWLIIDHYAIDCRWEQKLRPHVGRIMVIDDLADRRHGCDLLLDQNLHKNMDERYDGLVPETCLKLIGPKYSLLRPEFVEARKKSNVRDGVVRRFLIFFGGSDPSNETEKALEAILRINRPDIAVDVVVGEVNQRRLGLERLCASLPNTTYHCQIDNMAELMLNADLAIGAGGSSLWERCCLGLPSIIISIALNQVELARSAVKCGVADYMGEAGTISKDDLSRRIDHIIADPDLLKSISRSGMDLVDGNGSARVTDAMEALV